MIWKSNKHCIIFMLVSAIVLGLVYWYLLGVDPVLADKIAYTGFCFILFGGGLVSLYMAKRGE